MNTRRKKKKKKANQVGIENQEMIENSYN